jgi:hypothetical protein
MTDRETAKHLREWVKKPQSIFAWPTDGCGYKQHIKFVKYRNKYWTDERAEKDTFQQFVLEYADLLDRRQNQR